MKRVFKKIMRHARKEKCYHVSVPENIDLEIENTMRALGLTESEIRNAITSRNINS